MALIAVDTNIVVRLLTRDDPQQFERAEWYEHGLDFADAIHLAKSRHVDEFRTFDRGFVSHAAGLGTCRVLEPPARG